MNKQIIEHLRRFSSVLGKEKTWVSELNDGQLFELYLKIRNGESARAVARHAQTVWKVGRKSSSHSISQGILKFKQRISHLLLLPSCGTDEANAPGFPSAFGEESPLETMEGIARQYESRIKRMIAEERESGAKYPYLNRDLQALASLRKAILKQREWESAHGDPLNRARYENMKQRMERRFNGLMEYLGEEGQNRLVMAADRFLELAEKKCLTMHREEDGTYTTVPNPEEESEGST